MKSEFNLICGFYLEHVLSLLKVVVIMRQNMEKVLERDERLTELDSRAGGSSQMAFTDDL